MAKIIIDENTPKDVEEWLFKKGFETVNVSNLLLKSAKDSAIADYAIKKQNVNRHVRQRFCPTIPDLSKGTLLTVIIVKANPPPPSNIIETLNLAQNKINLKEIRNKLVIITKRKIRIIK